LQGARIFPKGSNVVRPKRQGEARTGSVSECCGARASAYPHPYPAPEGRGDSLGIRRSTDRAAARATHPRLTCHGSRPSPARRGPSAS
jgi:hypothetical protein